MPKVSVVVPMYNVEKYISECVGSIRNQTLKDIEIILVDDESPDNCGKMADEYAKEDSRIKVIHQKNKWLGGARNSGMKIATGEYISCVDADDYIAETYCEELYNFSVKNSVDVAYCTEINVNDNNQILDKPINLGLFEKRRILNRKDIVDKVYTEIITEYNMNINHNFFSRVLVDKGFLFDEDIRYAEDYDAALRVYKIADSVGYCDKAVYYYRQNEESIMHVVKYERLYQIIYLYKIREEFIKENNLKTKENLYNSAYLLISRIINAFPLVFAVENKSNTESKKQLRELFKDKYLNEAVGRLSIKGFNMGLFGKLCLLAIKIKSPLLIILLSKKQKSKQI